MLAANPPAVIHVFQSCIQPVTSESQSASLGSRIIAFSYDYLLISIYLIALFLVVFTLTRTADAQTWARFFSEPIRADVLAFLTTVLPVAIYFARTESSSRQASWGKAKRGLKVEATDGTRLSFTHALARSFLKLIPWQIAHTCLFKIPGWPANTGSPPFWVIIGLSVVWVLIIGYALSVLVRKSRQSIYDQILGIRVVVAV